MALHMVQLAKVACMLVQQCLVPPLTVPDTTPPSLPGHGSPAGEVAAHSPPPRFSPFHISSSKPAPSPPSHPPSPLPPPSALLVLEAPAPGLWAGAADAAEGGAWASTAPAPSPRTAGVDAAVSAHASGVVATLPVAAAGCEGRVMEWAEAGGWPAGTHSLVGGGATGQVLLLRPRPTAVAACLDAGLLHQGDAAGPTPLCHVVVGKEWALLV